MDIIKKITGRMTRKPANRAQLIALPKAVMIYTADGSVVITPQLARAIQKNLSGITKQAENFAPQNEFSEKRKQ